MTFEEYQDALVEAAKETQGEGYVGDDYYRQDCWMDYWEDGVEASEAVQEDMLYWEY